MFISKTTAVGFVLLGVISPIAAQHCHFALRGHVREAATNELLAYATIYVKEANRGAMTDESGYFSIADLCENTPYTVEVNHLECAHFTEIVRLTENTTVEFNLVHNAVLQEVVVVEKAVAPEATQAQSAVAQSDLEAARGLSLSETLRKIPGVSLLSSGGSVAKPVIQGLHGNRIAVVADGVTLQSQQWGNDHAPEIDPYSAASIKVVKGAAGLRYGVGAMAGAVVLEPSPLREKTGANGWLSLGGFSNGYGVVGSGLLDWKPRRSHLSFRAQATVKRSGNLRAPDYWLGNTGASEIDFSLSAGWHKKRWQHTVTLTQFSQDFAVLRAAHTGSLTDLQAAIASDTPRNNLNYFSYVIDRPKQTVQHNTLKYKAVYELNDIWRLNGQYSFQYNQRREYDRGRANSTANDKAQVSFQLWSNTLDLALEHQPIHHWQGGVGVQAIQQLNYVSKGGFIPDYQGWGGSVWAVERWRRYPKPWEFEAGLRFDHRGNHVSTTGNGYNDLDEHLSFSNVSGSVGGIYHLSRGMLAKLNTGYAWRPPHVNEMYARGVHHGAGRYEQGNPELRAEKAWNSNVSLEWESTTGNLSLSAFRNQVLDFIYLDQPRDSIVVTIRGPFPAYLYAQNNAVLQGLEAKASVRLFAGIWAEGQYSMLRGRRKLPESPSNEAGATHDWLPLMPADRFQYGLKWVIREQKPKSARGESFLRLSGTSALRQERIPAAGLTKAAPPGFSIFSLEAAHTFLVGKRLETHDKQANFLEVGLNIQNFSNVSYREYLDLFRYFADMPGINIGLRAKYVFGQ